MTNSIQELLSKRKPNNEPGDFLVIRSFVQKTYDCTPGLQIRNKSILVTVPNGAIAGDLRLHTHKLLDECTEATKIQIRIG